MRHLALATLAMSVMASFASANSPQVAEGQRLYMENCATCHGEDGRRGAGFQTPIWGQRTQIRKFETAQGLFEYNQMMMPFDDPSRLTDEQKWAIVAFLLANHGAIPRNGTLQPGDAARIPIQ
jgi:mono/diheme cytochrome c family protein